jgi:hypothetical protein
VESGNDELDARKGEMACAGELYDHPEPTLDLFSPGLERRGSTEPIVALAQLRAGLERMVARWP